MIPCHEQEHAQKALDRFTEAYKYATNLRAIASAVANRTQSFEDLLWEVVNGRLLGEVPVLFPVIDPECCECVPDLTGAEEGAIILDATTTWAIDGLGKLVNEPRLGRDNADYLSAIKLRIRANRSKGRANDIVDIAALYVGLIYTFTYYEFPGVKWQVNLSPGLDGGPLARILVGARALGSRGEVNFSTATTGIAMRWADSGGTVGSRWAWDGVAGALTRWQATIQA